MAEDIDRGARCERAGPRGVLHTSWAIAALRAAASAVGHGVLLAARLNVAPSVTHPSRAARDRRSGIGIG